MTATLPAVHRVGSAHPILLVLCVFVEVKVVDEPVANTGKRLEGAPQEGLKDTPLEGALPLNQLLLCHWVPRCVLYQPGAFMR